MTLLRSACTSLAALALVFAARTAAAQDAQLGVAVDGKVEVGSSSAAPTSGVAPSAAPSATDSGDDDALEPRTTTGKPPRSRRTKDRIRGGAGIGALGAFDDGGSGSLLTLEGRFGAQLNALFGIYAQLALSGGDMERRGGGDGRAAYATFAVIPELHILDELAIGVGPVVMSGARDVDQVGPRYTQFEDDPFDRFDDRRDDELVSRVGLMLRVSPAIGSVRPSGRIHAFRPSFEIAILGTDRSVVAPEEKVMVLAGVSLNWDTW